jgi:hypothetical protein
MANPFEYFPAVHELGKMKEKTDTEVKEKAHIE